MATGVKKSELESELLANIKARGLDNVIYRDLVNQYMVLWSDFKEMTKKMKTTENETYIKILRSDRLKTSKQMQVLYKSLGFEKIATLADSLPDEDDEL